MAFELSSVGGYMLTLRELQELTESEYSVEDTRKDLNSIVEFFRQRPIHDIAMHDVLNTRKLSLEIADQQRCFFVDEDILPAEIPEEFHAEALGLIRNGRITMAGRFVYPVMDVKGNVMGFCGWDKFVEPKYLDSKNHGYKAKDTTLYGMEKLPEYYRSNKPVYVVEGIVCCLFLRMMGLQALALLGSSMTPYVIQILKRFGDRLCIIPDNDAFQRSLETLDDTLAGEHLVSLAKRFLPKARIVQSKVAKDIDDSRLADNGRFEKQLIIDLQMVMVNPFIPLQTIVIR